MHDIINILKKENNYHPNNFKVDIPNYHPDSNDYKLWWREQIKRCIEGYWSNGRYMPPQLYTYANFGIIERIDDENSTSQKTTQPLLRDIEWLFFYNWLICRKFSGFEGDDKYSCNRKLIDPKFKKSTASKYLFRANGKLKEYINARDYLYKIHDKHLGLPIYENGALNMILLTSRGSGKSFWSMAGSLHEFIFNSAISFEQLLRELKSNTKTKVNCLITCELEDKANDLMNKIKTWYELMPGSYGDDDDYTPSPLYRTYTGSWSNKITQQVEKYYHTRDGTKSKRFDGSGSTISIITFNKDAYKTAGKRNSVTIIEEIGLCNNLLTFWGANKDVQRVGKNKFGSTLGIGTGGDIDRVQASKRIFENPLIYDCLAFDDTFENSGKQIGLFIPAYLGNNDFKDERGITNIEEGFAYYEEERRTLIKNNASSRDLDDEIMNRPLYPSEMFLSKKGNVFPVTELKQCLFNLISNPQRLNTGNKGVIIRSNTDKNGVQFINDLNEVYNYIDMFPLPKDYKSDKDYLKGCIRVWEHPIDNAPRGLYKIGYDTVHYDFVDNPESLISVLVYKGNVRFLSSDANIYYDTIVAEYTGRHDLLDKNNEVVELLSKYYNNAEIMMEVNIAVNIEYFKRRGLLHLLATQPTELLDKHIKHRQSNNIVGYIKSPELVSFLEQSTKEWLQKERGVDMDGKIIRNMDVINSKPLLEELIAYNREDNFDRINALFALMLAYKQENLDIDDDIYLSDNKFLKSMKDLLPRKKENLISN